ncbi:hypothetical protein MKX08_003591 [Trichoderma sp. CBMAI-0020]|nr:hypothetical protein MKX08_003591 [Trichoderma sp. CBMAI-0020]
MWMLVDVVDLSAPMLVAAALALGRRVVKTNTGCLPGLSYPSLAAPSGAVPLKTESNRGEQRRGADEDEDEKRDGPDEFGRRALSGPSFSG